MRMLNKKNIQKINIKEVKRITKEKLHASREQVMVNVLVAVEQAQPRATGILYFTLVLDETFIESKNIRKNIAIFTLFGNLDFIR